MINLELAVVIEDHHQFLAGLGLQTTILEHLIALATAV
uniref:Uncharacterized protein n=1 Tax=Rhizophora mucronata TaxID=61149 RepID=A0A2P2QL18_RHIMU